MHILIKGRVAAGRGRAHSQWAMARERPPDRASSSVALVGVAESLHSSRTARAGCSRARLSRPRRPSMFLLNSLPRPFACSTLTHRNWRPGLGSETSMVNLLSFWLSLATRIRKRCSNGPLMSSAWPSRLPITPLTLVIMPLPSSLWRTSSQPVMFLNGLQAPSCFFASTLRAKSAPTPGACTFNVSPPSHEPETVIFLMNSRHGSPISSSFTSADTSSRLPWRFLALGTTSSA
mmetsp:Transcript_86069/g.243710  ORF Transcript_86069/g.243710 Transcript_86069/m.243710 type:complete len:234 (+) Transcript_86069:166-867(+)